MALFDIAGDKAKDPGKRFLLGSDPETKEKVYFWMRRVPRAVDEEIRARYPGKWDKKLKRRIRQVEDIEAIGRERISWSLTRIDGPLFAPLDDEAVRLFSAAIGQQLEKGKNVYLNGSLNDETKGLLFEHVRVTEEKAGQFFQELNDIALEEEDEAAENLSLGSSGSSRQTSQK